MQKRLTSHFISIAQSLNLFIFVETYTWIERDYAKESTSRMERLKRMNHAAAVMGGMLLIHGGINPDENYFYDQLEVFDISKYFTSDKLEKHITDGSSGKSM